MLKKRIKAVVLVLWWVIVPMIIVEIVLQLTDPWGVLRAYNDLALLHQRFVKDDARGYILPEGELEFSNWSATMIDGNTREVPATNPDTTCTIAMIGDSLTFGQGVSDEDTFVNLLAQQFTDVYFINAGINGHNAGDALMSINTIKADGYIYIMLGNDVDPPLEIGQAPTIDLALPLYALTIMAIIDNDKKESAQAGIPPEEEHYPARFTQAVEAIATIDTVQIVGFSGDRPSEYAQRQIDDTMRFIERHHSPISKADPHPDPDGHIELAERLQPIVETWIAVRCPAR